MTNQTTVSPRYETLLRGILNGVVLAFLLSALCFAQSSPDGAISGRIFNPASGQYLRNAVVQIEETGQSVNSEDGGYFRISAVSPGAKTLVVTFTGFVSARTSVDVVAGKTANQEIYLNRLDAGSDSAIRLEKFVVKSDRDGNAKAIMEQRSSMNIQNSVASETFGDVSEGNVGEFMKHLPGVDVDYNGDKIRYVRLRGLNPAYTSVTLDGVSLPASDAAGAAGDARAFNFEQISISSIDSIEVLKTVSADQDANAPAGTINLRSKRGFDRKGRRIAWQANVSGFAEELTLKRTPGPDDRRSRKLLPGGSLEYSDVFFDRVAIVATISRSNVYSNPATMGATFNYTATSADQRPVVPTALTISNSSRTNDVFSSSVTADVKLTPSLILSLGALYSSTELWNLQRNNAYQAISRSVVLGVDPLREFSVGPGNGRVSTQSNAIDKQGKNMVYLPRFEYKYGDLTLDGRFSYALATTSYFPNSRDSVFSAGNPQLSGVNFTARRSDYSSADWNISQTGGLDWSDGTFYTGPAISSADGRLSRTQIYSGDITGTVRTRALVPATWKVGVKQKREVRDYEITRSLTTYNYIGPGSGTGAWGKSGSSWPIDASLVGAAARSISGGNAFLVNTIDVYKRFKETPQYFTSSITPANFYDAYVAGPKDYVEDINAAFVMGTVDLGKRIQFRGGVRYEETKGDALELDPLTAAEVRAAGYQVSAGRATTIPGIAYQYLSNPRIHHRGGYENFFPSSSLKYKFSDRFDAHLGFSRTIRRPNFRDIAGVWEVDDDRLRVNAPNPNLTPEMSNNLSARFAYYFEPVGIIAVNFFENTVKGLYISSEMTPKEYGYTGDLDLTNYTILSTVNGQDRTKIRGMELEYSQSLAFLPKPFDGLNVRASYTRNQAEVTLPEMAGQTGKAGLSYGKGRINVYSNLSWFDNIPLNADGTSYRRHRTSIDSGASYRVSPRLNIFLSARNISNAPLMTMQRIRDNPTVVTSYLALGTVLNLGLQGSF
jgi:TonB-dependent receptor